jgi:pimeloyl-ACP methyl ester carboxylesterase
MMAPIVDEPRTVRVASADGRLNVAVWGDAGFPTVLLQHGIRDHGRSWDWTVAALAGRYQVVAPDLRGHGDSDHAGSYAIADYVSDMAAVADALALERFHLVGHSLGGVIGLRYAAAFPDRVAALCGIECIELPIVRDQRESPKTHPHRLRRWIEERRAGLRRRPRRYASAAEAEARLAEGRPELDPATIAHLTRYATFAETDGTVSWKYDNAARFRPPDDADGRDLDAALAAIECPVTLIYGDSGWIPLPPADRLGLLRDHRVVRVPNAGHWLHHERRDRFLDIVQTFLCQHQDTNPHA